jgi:hypothetical protein
MCWALNHQNNIEMAQGHISLSALFDEVIVALVFTFPYNLQIMYCMQAC